MLALTVLGITSSPSRAGHHGQEGVVYVESNIGTSPGNNSIFAFRRDEDGQLTPLPGSPFLTGGTGIGPTLELGPYDSDQNLVVDPEHKLLLAVNGGSNSITVFHIREDGSLVPVQGSPFPSGGVNPVSVGLAGRLLCVVNKNMDPNQDPSTSLPNYTTFRVTSHGKLIPVPHSTIFVDQGSSPSQALIAPGDRLVFGADFLGGLLQSFVILSNGRLFQRPPLPLPESEFLGTGIPDWGSAWRRTRGGGFSTSASSRSTGWASMYTIASDISDSCGVSPTAASRSAGSSPTPTAPVSTPRTPPTTRSPSSTQPTR